MTRSYAHGSVYDRRPLLARNSLNERVAITVMLLACSLVGVILAALSS